MSFLKDISQKSLLFILEIFCFQAWCFPQVDHYRFEHITTNNGLSHSIVTSILQDQMGFIWFATGDGIDRYDGYEFKVYKPDPNDPSNKMVGNKINQIITDRQRHSNILSLDNNFLPKTDWFFLHFRNNEFKYFLSFDILLQQITFNLHFKSDFQKNTFKLKFFTSRS